MATPKKLVNFWGPDSKVGIMPGWSGMENVQKPETEKNKKWKTKWKTAPSWNGEKMAKNGFLREFFFHYFFHFRAIFSPFLPLSSLGPFSISISIFLSISGFWPFSMPYQPGMIPTPKKTRRWANESGQVRPRQGTLEALHWIFLLFLQYLCAI